MDDQPATVQLLTEHDGLYLMCRFFAGVGSLATVDGVRQDGCLAEHLEFQDACIDRQGNRQDVLLCRPPVPRGTVLAQGTEPSPPINHRRLLREACKLVIPAPFAKGGHESLIRLPDLTLHGSPSDLDLTRFYEGRHALSSVGPVRAGSIGKLQNVCATWHTSPIKTIAQAREREVIVAAAAAPTNTAIMPRVLNALIGTRFKPIIGYDPGAGLTLAVERGEAEGVCGLSWSTIKASRPHWIRDRLLNVIVQMGLDKLPDLPSVPAALDQVADPVKKQVLTLILLRQEPGRPVAAPPGVPPERLAALRRAFDLTMKDPDFVAEATKLQMEIEPLTAAAIDTLLATAYATPRPIVQQAAELLEPAK